MDIKAHMTDDKLELYSFYWSEARLLIAALALFLGGTPPFIYYFPGLYMRTGSLLTLAWIISGVVSAYLIYRWNKGGKKVFGKNVQLDTYAFFVNVVTGFNLGLAGLIGRNIGMSISSNKTVFIIVGILYLVTAGYLWKRWSESGKRLFF
jgi:hypothetical protein